VRTLWNETTKTSPSDDPGAYNCAVGDLIYLTTRARDDDTNEVEKADIQSVLDYLETIRNRVASGDFPIIQPPIDQSPIIQPPIDQPTIIQPLNIGPAIPTKLKTYNYPNPFNPLEKATHIRCELTQASTVTIKICDIAGNSVKDLE